MPALTIPAAEPIKNWDEEAIGARTEEQQRRLNRARMGRQHTNLTGGLLEDEDPLLIKPLLGQ